jgi:cell division inhibitor SulA
MSRHRPPPEELLPEALSPEKLSLEELSPEELSPEQLWQRAGLWRASSIDCNFTKGVPTGFKVLDEHLPGHGWPADGVTELLHEQYGIGELRLLTPALAHLSQEQNRWLLWVSPPYIPYPPALLNAGIDLTSVLIVKPKTTGDTLWVLEKALSSKSCSAVLAWPGNINAKQIRRLQVASKKGNSWSILFRPGSAAQNASPAELRIQLFAASSPHTSTSINLKILKRRGGWATGMINLHFSDKLNQVAPDFQAPVTDFCEQPLFKIDGRSNGLKLH